MILARKKWFWWHRDVVVITTAQLHSTKHELSLCAGSSPARGVSDISDDEDLWRWTRLEIRLNVFRRLTIPQTQFIIIINTAWNVFKYGVISGPYFPVFSPNTGKYGPEIPPYLDTFHALKTDPTQIHIHYFWKMLLRNSKENDDNWIFPIFFTFTPLFSLEIETEGRREGGGGGGGDHFREFTCAYGV